MREHFLHEKRDAKIFPIYGIYSIHALLKVNCVADDVTLEIEPRPSINTKLESDA